jgi:heat shock protein HtpX
MIMALRKIEGRGELQSAPSAVMEMCVDNPRSGFVDLFATHPSIQRRVDALVRFAGGHDPGVLALPEPTPETEASEDVPRKSSPESPQPGGAFLPSQSPLATGGQPGPWGPHSPVGTPPSSPWGPRRDG